MKGLLTELGMNTFTTVSMVISFVAFVGVLIWVYTRPHKEIDALARLYDDDQPATASEVAPQTTTVQEL